ncbi:hypothetical protein [Thalassotalea sp. ND16A]|uniref:hypothetical protein n=1 Tax=Thalassotalea sp. ND16A TaxID=1535422 RepID=UPI00051A277F|nr:hypothetical protein [Thalassotalea sp. ND16A]KGJ99883.1 hypothetical protein ND16A_3671 [Thalassotalea sp. ND16A]
MGLFNFLFGSSSTSSNIETTDINPASGLPMTSGIGSVDVAGNPYGTDMSDSFSSSIDDSFSSMDTSSCFDDPFDSFDSGCSSFDDW